MDLKKNISENNHFEDDQKDYDMKIPDDYSNFQKNLDHKLNDSNSVYEEYENKPFYLNPRRNSFYLQLMHGFLKIIRIFHVSQFNYL